MTFLHSQCLENLGLSQVDSASGEVASVSVGEVLKADYFGDKLGENL